MEVEEEDKKNDVAEKQEENEDEDSVDDEDEEPDTVVRKDSVGSADSRAEFLDSEEEELEEEDDVELEIVKEDLPSSSKPSEERIDDGEEADSESDDTKIKKKPKTEVKKSKKKKKKKKKKKMDGKDVFINSEPRKRTRTQPNKRKKIRKILTEDKLQAETLQALREEEERQKRLGLFTREEPSNDAGVSFELLDDDNDAGFPEISYNFDFMDNIDVDIQPLSGEGLEEMLSVPTTSDASGSLGLMELTTENTKTAPEISSVPMETPKLHQSESNASLTNEVSRLHLLLNTDSRDITGAPSSVHSAVTAGVPTTQNGTPVATDKPVSQTFPFSPVSEPPKISPLPSDGQTLPISTLGSLLSSSNVQSSDSSSSILFQTLSMTSQSMTNSTASAVGFDGQKPLATPQYTGFSKPTPVSSRPAVSQSSEVICISSESSDDERVKKKQQQQPIQKSAPIDTISISSGSESSNDDVIFAGTDDNEIAEQDPDVNNSGMHVNDAMNQPDLDGRVLVNKNRPPDEPEIYLSPRLARAVLPHQIGGIRFMFDNIVESLEHYKKSNGFGCILAHSMGLGKTLQVISFIDVFLRYTEGKTALCVVPVNTLLNWVAEFEMWLPATKDKSENPEDGEVTKPRTFKVRLLSETHKTTEARANVISSWKTDGGVLLMGYEMFRLLTNQKSRRRKKKKQKNAPPGGIIETIDIDEEDKILELTAEIYENLVNPGPDLIVCDEGHRIKNSHASISQALKQIHTRRRIVLTGYPLQNNLMEYWCMVDFVRPNFLGAKQEFSNMFERPISNGQCADSNEGDIRLMRFRSHVLHSLLKGFVQRRSHSVLKNSLPPKEEYVLLIRLSQWQKKLYNNFIKLQKEQGSGSWCSALNPIKAFSICCKIWNHPDVLYRAVIRKSLEEQQSNDQNSLLDIDLDLPEAVMESILKKARRKREARAEKSLEAVPGSSGTLVQSVGFSPFGDEKERGMSYDWAIDLLEDYSSNKIEFSGKMLILMQIVEHSVNSGDKILVFSQSLTTLTLMEEFLSEIDVPNPPNGPQFQRKWRRNESYLRLDGNTSTTDREKMIQLFNDKNNNTIHLFLLSTRAGCLGINLVGANRVVVFDISWNPCHDAQAVCRVYRYGQRKKCAIYRLICDQSMEKKIYDRQISKQGMADRVVDELNPIQSLERQDITKLLIYNDEELPPPNIDDEWMQECNDETLKHTCKVYGHWLTRKPFHHESLLMECKGSRLTKAEKRAAQKGYEQEKRASNSCNYSRPSYTNFYAAAGYPEKTTARSKFGVLSKSSTTANKPVANVRPIQSTPYPMQPSGSSGLSSESGDSQIISHLQRAGINVRKTVASQDIPLPQSSVGPNSKPLVSAGESFYMITGTKGLYIGTATGRIFALRSQKTEENKPPSPNVTGPGGQMVTTRERESQIIKTAFNAMIRRNQGPRQPMRYQYSPNQPIRAGGFPSNFGAMPGNTNLVDLRTGQNFGMNQQNSLLTQQRPIMSPQIMMGQQNNMLNQQNFPTPQQNPMLSEQGGIMTQQNGGMTQQNGGMTQQNGGMTQQNGGMNQQIGNMTQQYGIVPQQNGGSQNLNQGSSQQNLPQSAHMEQNQVMGMPQTNMMQQNFATHPQLMNYAMMNQQNFAATTYGMTPNFFPQHWANPLQSVPMFQSPVVTNGIMQQTNNPNMMQQKDTSIVTSQTNDDESQSILPTMSLDMMEDSNENDVPTDETLTQQVTTSLPSLSSLLIGQQNLQRLLTQDGSAGSSN